MIQEEKEELLKQANQPVDIWEYCYITEDGLIYTPRIVDDVIIKTGLEVYQETPPTPQPNKIDTLEARVVTQEAVTDALLFDILPSMMGL